MLPAANLVKLPDAIGYEQAAAVMLKGLTVQYLLRQTHALKAGETVLFHAAAGVSAPSPATGQALGARLIGVAGSPEKAERAKALGAWACIDSSREDVVQRVLELTDGRKCPVVYDSVGKDTWETSLDCGPARPAGELRQRLGAGHRVNLGCWRRRGRST